MNRNIHNGSELEALIRKYKNLVYTVVASVIGHCHKQDIEECIADVFVSLWQSGHDSAQEDISNLVITVARRRAIDKMRSMKRCVWEELNDEISSAGLLEDEVLVNLNSDIIRRALISLPAPDGEIFTRRYYYCQSIKEIARALKVKPKYIENRLYQSKKTIRQKLIALKINI
ncbi:MAG: sigma-70 family RNA polymerase sigma factor [Eubacteriales bacterium]|nr:sigma-70 family RNA polymerase sigma factor [Eubacteriales bacterium]